MKRLFIISCSLLLSTGILFAQKGKGKTKKPTTSAADLAAAKAAQEQSLAQEKAKKEAEAAEARAKADAEFEKRYERKILPENQNKYSARPILDKDIMFRKSVWRRIDLKEKQNKGFMFAGKELPTLIIEYIRRGKIKAYSSSDSLDLGRVLTLEELKGRLKDPSIEEGDPNDPNYVPISNTDIPTKDLSIIDLKEDVIFDKKRSRMYYDILTMTIFIPAAKNPKGFDQPVATILYKDIVALFKKDTRAMWFNRLNDSEHKNYVDAFDLRLFSSFITKVSNAEDSELQDIYGDAKAGRYGAEKAANDLMEFEHNTWEF